MKLAILLGTSLLACPALATAALPRAEQIQGLYLGHWNDAEAEARLIAMGGNNFKLLIRCEKDGTIERLELDGRSDGESLAFTSVTGAVSAGASWTSSGLKGTVGKDGSLEFKRVKRTSPTLGKQPPGGAVILIDGQSFDNMKPARGEWKPTDPEDGSIEVPGGGMRSVPKFEGSYDAHVEFRCNFKPAARSQGRGNSGCYLPNGNEIQVLDSFGTVTYLGGGCGGLYRFRDPDTMEPIPSLAGRKENAFNRSSLPPLAWQTYDIEWRVREDDPSKGLLTVHHNGIRIHDAVELKHRPGTFHFQDHGNPVRYRNIWVKEL